MEPVARLISHAKAAQEAHMSKMALAAWITFPLTLYLLDGDANSLFTRNCGRVSF